MAEATVGGHRMYYEDLGNTHGPVLVMVHGASTSSVWFEGLIPHLVSAFRVIAPHHRGMGKSERVDAMPPTAWNDDLLELVNQLGIERFHLAGSALGARIALRASLSARERVMSLTIDAPILFETPEGSQAIETMFGGELPEPLAASIERANGHDWRQVLDSFLRIRQTPGLKELYDFRGELGQLRCPALVCRGDIENVAAPISHSLQAHAEIADSRLWIEPSTPFSALHFAAAAAGGRVRDFLLASAE